MAKHAAKLKSITCTDPEIWVFGSVMDSTGELAFLANGKLVIGIRRNRMQLEVDGQIDWYQSARLEKVVYVVK